MASDEQVFRCQGSDGHVYDICRGADGCDVGPTSLGPTAAFDSLWTTDGRAVQYVCKGRYHLEGSSIELTTDDPNAP